jgi:hypothetical protein
LVYNKDWKDPVWSKVLGGVFLILVIKVYAFASAISFSEIFLTEWFALKVPVNLLTISVIVIAGAEGYYFVGYRLRRVQPLKVKTDIHQFLSERWVLIFTMRGVSNKEQLSIASSDYTPTTIKKSKLPTCKATNFSLSIMSTVNSNFPRHFFHHLGEKYFTPIRYIRGPIFDYQP